MPVMFSVINTPHCLFISTLPLYYDTQLYNKKHMYHCSLNQIEQNIKIIIGKLLLPLSLVVLKKDALNEIGGFVLAEIFVQFGLTLTTSHEILCMSVSQLGK